MKYKIMLTSEDGVSCLREGYASLSKAEHVLDKLKEQYGEGQMLWIESYRHDVAVSF